MSARVFLDTNILVYCFDHSDKKKQQQADALVDAALRDHSGVISNQVIQEFLNVASRKFVKPMTPTEARTYLQTVLSPLCEVFSSIALYQQALSVQEETGYSFYDCLIIAAALEAKCEILYSEDLHPGHTVRGLTIQNPFVAQFKTR
jgi:predicted nucleic acid-binding protein